MSTATAEGQRPDQSELSKGVGKTLGRRNLFELLDCNQSKAHNFNGTHGVHGGGMAGGGGGGIKAQGWLVLPVVHAVVHVFHTVCPQTVGKCPLASHASTASHDFFPKTVQFERYPPPPMWEMQHRARGFQITKC